MFFFFSFNFVAIIFCGQISYCIVYKCQDLVKLDSLRIVWKLLYFLYLQLNPNFLISRALFYNSILVSITYPLQLDFYLYNFIKRVLKPFHICFILTKNILEKTLIRRARKVWAHFDLIACPSVAWSSCTRVKIIDFVVLVDIRTIWFQPYLVILWVKLNSLNFAYGLSPWLRNY